jgi:AcrR family transcriptional regulator
MTAVTFAPPHLTPRPPVARRRGRPPRVDREMIAEAVLDVGFDDLTYAAVGSRLRVSLATLFRHVRGRDELSRVGLDLAVRRHVWPDLDGPWRSMLEIWALAAWQLWAQHPGAVVEVSRGVVPPTVAHLTDEVGSALQRAGFTAENAMRAVDLVFDLVTDSRRGVEMLAQGLPESSLMRGAMDDAIRADPLAWFTGKLDVVLAGIAAQLAPEPSALSRTGGAKAAA